MIKELGPVLTSLMVSGRNASGMASELGSMMVTEQIDAMRALGTDPLKKLVMPRIVATVIMLFFLTIISDAVGILGGAAVSVFMLGQDGSQYFHTAYQSLHYADILQGLVKPLFFGFIISTIGCYYGMTTRGGTQGVGRSTTQAVVVSSVLIIAVGFCHQPLHDRHLRTVIRGEDASTQADLALQAEIPTSQLHPDAPAVRLRACFDRLRRTRMFLKNISFEVRARRNPHPARPCGRRKERSAQTGRRSVEARTPAAFLSSAKK